MPIKGGTIGCCWLPVVDDEEDGATGFGIIRLLPSVVVDEDTSVVVPDVVWLPVVEFVLIGDAEDSFFPGLFKGAVVVSGGRGLEALLSLVSDGSAVLLWAGSSSGDGLLTSDAVLILSFWLRSSNSPGCGSQEPVLIFENTAAAVVLTCSILFKKQLEYDKPCTETRNWLFKLFRNATNNSEWWTNESRIDKMTLGKR